MLYYRYRPGTELSIKELIYDELFFASAEECNDPYEGKIFAVFDKNLVRWTNLIEAATKGLHLGAFDDLLHKVIGYFVECSPVFVNEVLKEPDEVIIGKIATSNSERMILPYILRAIKEYIVLYMPSEHYFASFSKRADNYLMWSHYANNHHGYCLVFRLREGKLFQHPEFYKDGFSHITPDGLFPQMTMGVKKELEMRDVEYLENPDCLDAFLCFPKEVYGEECEEEKLKKHGEEYANVYMKKHAVWQYEEEARLVLSSGISWLAGKPLTVSKYQRLFHYDSTQLVGIVLGAKMQVEQRNRIREILLDKVDKWYGKTSGEKIVSDFVVFEERLLEDNRCIEIEPVELYSGTQVYSASHTEFEKRYLRWKEGEAIRFSGITSERVIIK